MFCYADVYCHTPAPGQVVVGSTWQTVIRAALAEWNAAGADFVFRERAAEPDEDPCQIQDDVVIIIASPGRGCAGESVERTEAGNAYISVLPRSVRIYVKEHADTDRVRRVLLHELGHVVGLGHPDEKGQNVPAIMNRGGQRHSHLQPDDITGIQALYGVAPEPKELVGFFEVPRHDSFQSGVGVISGWVCDAEEIEIVFNDDHTDPWRVGYGTRRSDTEGTCGDDNNGFGLLFNWNLLQDGTHTVTVLVDGEELGNATVHVTTLGEEFPQGMEGEYALEDFPYPGQSVVVEWEESLQNFVIIEHNGR